MGMKPIRQPFILSINGDFEKVKSRIRKGLSQ